MANKLNTRIILRNDSTSGWAAIQDDENYILLKGEVGLEFVTTSATVDGVLTEIPTGKVKMKIGDGVHTWSELSYFGGDECHVTEVTVAAGENHKSAITTAVAGTTVNKGDIAIVKEAIIALEEGQSVNADKNIIGSDGKVVCAQRYQYTAYVYGETADGSSDWKAMDGNYSAKNVYFDTDFVFTTNVGTVTGVTSNKTVAAKGKSVKQFFDGLFAKETAGAIDTSATSKGQPYVNITLTGAGDYEVGTEVTPSYSASFEDGKYTFGPEPTGVEVTSWAVTSTKSESWSAKSGNCSKFTVADGENYTVTATATHTAGDYALSNIGNTGTVQIAAGSKSKTSSAITGHRKQFYGSNTSVMELTSNNIRALDGNCKPGNKFTGTYAGSNVNGFKLEIKEGTKQVVIALYGKSLKNVYNVGGFGTDIVSNFVEASASKDISVAGASNYTGVNYKVYVFAPDAALSANTYEVVIG